MVVLLSDATTVGCFPGCWGMEAAVQVPWVVPVSATLILYWESSLVSKRSGSCRCYHFRLMEHFLGQFFCKLAMFLGGRWLFCLLGRTVQPG